MPAMLASGSGNGVANRNERPAWPPGMPIIGWRNAYVRRIQAVTAKRNLGLHTGCTWRGVFVVLLKRRNSVAVGARMIPWRGSWQ